MLVKDIFCILSLSMLMISFCMLGSAIGFFWLLKILHDQLSQYLEKKNTD